MVKIVQINLGKRKTAVGYLYDLTNQEKYEISLIQELYIYKNSIRNLDNNGMIFENSNSNENPRSCIWIKSNLSRHSEAIQLVEYSDKDCVAVKMRIKDIQGNREVIICSAYFLGINESRRNVISEKLNKLIDHCKFNQIELIVGCDANAHNTIWGSKNDCPRGKTLLEYLTINNLFLINEGDSPNWERNNLLL